MRRDFFKSLVGIAVGSGAAATATKTDFSDPYRFRITVSASEQRWYDPNTGKLVRRMRLSDDGMWQTREPLPLEGCDDELQY